MKSVNPYENCRAQSSQAWIRFTPPANKLSGEDPDGSPALKLADIGIAMGQGTDIAIEAADITILRDQLELIPQAVRLSVETFRKIRQNLFWAFFYNLVAIPLAVFGALHPVIAEIAMATSSVTVVSNANLLRRGFLTQRHRGGETRS